ncbi:MAG: hypothetical protein NC200_02335 [Candidatus Gastranaerophilales bacterium]|nr:hypothetical protein [Candidatus Gastranaerophilales bacterium]
MAVIIPTKISASVLIAICLSRPVSTQLEVPSTWLAAPIDKPIAMSLFTLIVSRILCPKTAPKTPVKATMQAVNSGMPPKDFDISTAIGAVTDLGSRDISTFRLAWQHFAVTNVDKSAHIVANKNAV